MPQPIRTEGLIPISWSRINTLQMCSISYQKQYVQRIRTPRSLPAYRGSLIDLLLQHVLSPPMGAGYDLALEERAHELARSLWQEGVYDDGQVLHEWNIEWTLHQQEVAHAIKMTRGYMDKIGHRLDLDWSGEPPLQRELRVHIEQDGGPGIEVLAVPDIVERDLSVIDIKVRDRDKAKEGRQSEQLSINAWAIWKLYGQETTRVAIHRLNPHKPKEPEVKQSVRELRDHLVTERRILRAAEAIRIGMETGMFGLPAPADHWKCSRRYCQFYVDCEWRR